MNFAVWCATTGCGISSKTLFDDGLPKQVRSHLWFHLYLTLRRILHEPGGIQSSVALPGDDAEGNFIQYITNDPYENQYEHFVLPVSYGLTKAGQARLNQSIEVFVYCILGAQVNVRSSILGDIDSA